MTNDLLKHKQSSGKKMAEIDLRTIAIKTLVNEKEYEEITGNAEQAGMARGAYLRALGMEHQIVIPKPAISREALIELGRIGNNLNQVAKALNAGQSTELMEVLGIIRELKGRLLHG